MHSKWNIHDFLKEHPQGLPEKCDKFIALFCSDIYICRLIQQRLRKSNNFKSLWAKDLTVEWFEEKLQGPDLFSTQETWLILEADVLSAKVIKFLEEKKLNLDQQFIFFFFKESAFFEKIVREFQGIFFSLTPPFFWDMQKLLILWCEEIGVRLSFEAKNYVMDVVPHTSEDFFRLLSLLHMVYPEHKELNPAMITPYIEKKRLDQFVLAKALGEKKFSYFFESLLNLNLDFEDSRRFFAFLQGHLMKIADPSYAQNKTRPSKYDKEIMSCAGLWKKEQIERGVRNFARLEILAKKKDIFLMTELRRQYLLTFS
ncbi:MAG: hypothetical protein KBD63_01765 [Bacteriovoracaceae bacterium]|nr:hypothetical protein [Bacteriovoracaceae bacterium]